MKPPADAPAVRPPAESELDTYPDSDAPAAAQPTPAAPTQAVPVVPTQAVPVAPVQPVPLQPALTDREQQILAFERQWWRHAGAKEQAIRDTFQLSATRYYQLLNGLLDNPAALAADPVLVGRLRRLRSARARSRRR
jgi:hypothetical protein